MNTSTAETQAQVSIPSNINPVVTGVPAQQSRDGTLALGTSTLASAGLASAQNTASSSQNKKRVSENRLNPDSRNVRPKTMQPPSMQPRSNARDADALGISMFSRFSPHYEIASGSDKDGAHLVNNALQATVLDPKELEGATFMDIGRKMLKQTGVAMNGANLGSYNAPHFERYRDFLLKAKESCVALLHIPPEDDEDAPSRATVIRMAGRKSANDPKPQPYWLVLDAARPPSGGQQLPHFALLRDAVSDFHQPHEGNLNVFYPDDVLPPVQNGQGCFIKGKGFVPVEHLTDAERQSLPAGLQFCGRLQARDAQGLGIKLMPNPYGIHIEAPVPGGSSVAQLINYLFQGVLIAPRSIGNDSVDSAALVVQQHAGVIMLSAAIDNFQGDTRLEKAVAAAGTALCKVGELGSAKGGSLIALMHLSGRRDDKQSGHWLLMESNAQTGKRFSGKDGLTLALKHIAKSNDAYHPGSPNKLCITYPDRCLPPLKGGSGVYLPNEGFVPAQYLQPDEMTWLRQHSYPDLQLRSSTAPTSIPQSDPQPTSSQPHATPTLVPLDNAAYGIRLVQGSQPLYHPEQRQGEGGCPAHCINMLMQCTVVPPNGPLNTATAKQTASMLAQLAKVEVRERIIFPKDPSHRQIYDDAKQTIRHSGAAVLEMGTLGSGNNHQVALMHAAANVFGSSADRWVVMDTRDALSGLPAQWFFNDLDGALDWAAKRNEKENSEHVGNNSLGMPIYVPKQVLSLNYPVQPLPMVPGTAGAYVAGQGYTLHASAAPQGQSAQQSQMQAQPQEPVVQQEEREQSSAQDGQQVSSMPGTSEAAAPIMFKGPADKDIQNLASDYQQEIKRYVKQCERKRAASPDDVSLHRKLQTRMTAYVHFYQELKKQKRLSADWLTEQALPSQYLLRTLKALSGQLPTATNNPAQLRQQVITQYTVENSIPQISLTMFDQFPSPIQIRLLESAIGRYQSVKGASYHHAVNDALDLRLYVTKNAQGQDLQVTSSFLPLFTENEKLLKAAEQGTGSLSSGNIGVLRRWIYATELQWVPSSQQAAMNPVLSALNAVQSTGNEDKKSFLNNATVTTWAEPQFKPYVKDRLWSVARWYFNNKADLSQSPAVPEPKFSMDARLLENYVRNGAAEGGSNPREAKRQILTPILDALSAQALDNGHYVARQLLRYSPDAAQFIANVTNLLPQGQVLDAAQTGALTELYGWYREQYVE